MHLDLKGHHLSHLNRHMREVMFGEDLFESLVKEILKGLVNVQGFQTCSNPTRPGFRFYHSTEDFSKCAKTVWPGFVGTMNSTHKIKFVEVDVVLVTYVSLDMFCGIVLVQMGFGLHTYQRRYDAFIAPNSEPGWWRYVSPARAEHKNEHHESWSFEALRKQLHCVVDDIPAKLAFLLQVSFIQHNSSGMTPQTIVLKNTIILSGLLEPPKDIDIQSFTLRWRQISVTLLWHVRKRVWGNISDWQQFHSDWHIWLCSNLSLLSTSVVDLVGTIEIYPKKPSFHCLVWVSFSLVATNAHL